MGSWGALGPGVTDAPADAFYTVHDFLLMQSSQRALTADGQSGRHRTRASRPHTPSPSCTQTHGPDLATTSQAPSARDACEGAPGLCPAPIAGEPHKIPGAEARLTAGRAGGVKPGAPRWATSHHHHTPSCTLTGRAHPHPAPPIRARTRYLRLSGCRMIATLVGTALHGIRVHGSIPLKGRPHLGSFSPHRATARIGRCPNYSHNEPKTRARLLTTSAS